MTLIFDKYDRRDWITKVHFFREYIQKNRQSHILIPITIRVEDTIDPTNFDPIHTVLLTCLIEYLRKSKITYFIEMNKKLFDHFNNTLYYNNIRQHIDSNIYSESNLWQIKSDKAIFYSIAVTNFFAKNFFEGYDLTGLKVSLDEIYANIADHSQSNGNAFSFIHYKENERKICVAICDFGLGIPHTLRQADNRFPDDITALRESLEIGITAKTRKYNRGFGLDNVVTGLSNGGILRIVSNRALLFCTNDKNNIKLYPLDFDFKGTLIYFDVYIDSFEKEELIDGNISL